MHNSGKLANTAKVAIKWRARFARRQSLWGAQL